MPQLVLPIFPQGSTEASTISSHYRAFDPIGHGVVCRLSSTRQCYNAREKRRPFDRAVREGLDCNEVDEHAEREFHDTEEGLLRNVGFGDLGARLELAGLALPFLDARWASFGL